MRTWIVLIILLFLASPCYADPGLANIERETGSGALSVSYDATRNGYLIGVRVHLSTAATQESLTVTLDSASGSTYDVVLLSQAMATYTDLSWVPAGKIFIQAGDTVTVSWTNTDATTWGAEISYEN